MSEEQYPLPWNPDESCKIDNKLIQTRLDQYPEVEVDGTLFNRDCDGLDNTIPRRKDRFITICPDELPDVPKEVLKNKHFETVPFPGVISTEIPKALLAQLLGCCLKDRTAGFDFEAHEELDDNGDKVELDFEDEDNPVTKAFTIQLGTEGYSYLRIGLNIKPELCFCDEDCGDEDYIHLKVNFGVEYHDDTEDPIEDPDLTITDEQLTNLVTRFGGGGGGNPLCSRKMFAVYQGNGFMPYGGVSEIVDAPVSAQLAPYLSNSTLIQNAVYKLEYFCEDDTWYVTDGACGTVVPTYTGRSDRVTSAEGAKNSQWTGYFILDSSHASELVYELDSNESTTTPANAFVNGISFTISPGPDNNPRHAIRYQFTLKEGASGSLVYYATVIDSISCRPTTYRLIIKVKEIPLEEEEVEGDGEEEQSNENE